MERSFNIYLNLSLKILIKNKICGITGDLSNMETLYYLKSFSIKH